MRRIRLPSPRALAALILPSLLGGCNMEVLFPAGDVARQQAHLLTVSTILMLLIIIPVMALTILFAWRYRHNNQDAPYDPDWDHSTGLELLIWSAPLAIIIALGAITWMSSHLLDPYRPIGQIAPGKAVAAQAKPLEIDVVALDWKWLFIYPEQGIATVNELALPTDRQVRFRITASSVMNSFYVPALAGQVYAMPGMETKLHAVLNKTGRFQGFSANYSGAGFSGMHFVTTGTDEAGFAQWVAQKKAAGRMLDRATYQTLAKPSEDVPPASWSSVDPSLFNRVVNMCVADGTPCLHDVMMTDMGMKPETGAHQPSGRKGALERSPAELGTSPREEPARPNAPTPHSHT